MSVSQPPNQIFTQTPEGFEQLTWLIGSIVEANESAYLEISEVDGNIVCTDRNGQGLRLPSDVLSANNHAPEFIDSERTTPYLYTYLIIPADGIADDLERIKGTVVPPEERWNAENMPAEVMDLTSLGGENAELAGLAQTLMNYITVKANTEGIYTDVQLQEKYAAAMAAVLAIMHKLNRDQGILDDNVTTKLNVMRAGGSVEILTRAVSDEFIPNQYPGAKRIVTNPQGKQGTVEQDSMMLGVIDATGELLNIQAGDTIRAQEVVVASNATLIGFMIVLEYLKRKPAKMEVIAPFITQPGVADFIEFCRQRGIDLQMVTASIAPALNNNWYVVMPPDNDSDGRATNPQYLEVTRQLDRTEDEASDVYFMGDGGDILNFLLKYKDASAEEVRDYMMPLIAGLLRELSATEATLMRQVLPDLIDHIEV